MPCEWDQSKRRGNRAKHGVDFDEACSVFDDAPEVFDDFVHSENEQRYTAIGFSYRGRLLTVTFTIRNDYYRIISARRATAADSKRYAEAHG